MLALLNNFFKYYSIKYNENYTLTLMFAAIVISQIPSKKKNDKLTV